MSAIVFMTWPMEDGGGGEEEVDAQSEVTTGQQQEHHTQKRWGGDGRTEGREEGRKEVCNEEKERRERERVCVIERWKMSDGAGEGAFACQMLMSAVCGVCTAGGRDEIPFSTRRSSGQ